MKRAGYINDLHLHQITCDRNKMKTMAYTKSKPKFESCQE